MTGHPADTRYGIFAIADMQVALPLGELREVIPRPVTFERLPATAPGLIGAVNLRHQVVPVLDLRLAMGMTADTEMDTVVIVVQDHQIFGLLASDVRGVVQLRREHLVMLAGDSALTRCMFERPDDFSVVSVLDSAAIRRLPGIPVTRLHEMASVAFSGRAVDGQRPPDPDTRTLILLNTASFGLCLDVARIHSVIPELLVKSSPMTGGAVLGVIPLDQYQVPVLDPLVHLGLGRLNGVEAQRGVALNFEQGLLVFAVTSVEQIVAVPTADILPLPSFSFATPPALSGVITGQGDRTYLVLEDEVLRRDAELSALAALAIPDQDEPDIIATAEPGADTHESRKFITLHAGVEVATPLNDISEILPYPTDVVPMAGRHPGICGVFTHRGAVIPLACTTSLLGRDEPVLDRTARVLVVESEHGLVGFVVRSLQAIEDSVWEEPAKHSLRMDDVLATSPLVEVVEGGRRRMLPNVDFRATADALTQRSLADT